MSNAQESSKRAGDLLNRLQAHGFFTGLDQSTQLALIAELSEIELPVGALLFAQGDPGDSLFFLDEGRLQVILQTGESEEMIIDVLGPGSLIGEMALLSGRPRASAVRALEYCTIIKLAKSGCDRLIADHPQFQQTILDLATPRFRRTQAAGVLQAFFGDLDTQTLHELQEQMEWRHISGGNILFRQGDPGDCMALVVNGRLRITARYPEGDIQFTAEIGRGQTVGEFSLLTGEPRSADVHATRDTDLLLLSVAAFERISLTYPQIGLQMARHIARRNSAGGRPEAKGASAALSLALVPLSPGIDLTAFARQLRDEMNSFGPALLFNAAEFDAHFGKEGASRAQAGDPINVPILGWLTELEETTQFVIYQADVHDSVWTRRCLHQADRIVLVADPADDPALIALEEAIAGDHPLARSELLLLHAAQAIPNGTAAWLAPRSVGRHYHHLRAGSRSDLRRFIRRLTGRPLGLVLSGGGARGFAHIGVYRALVEAGVEIDLIGGTSVGSLIGAGLAAEFDGEQMMDVARQYASRGALLDYTFPVASLFEGEKFSHMLATVFAAGEIEDLYRPFFCVSSNLTEMRPFVHDSGLLWEAVRASVAIPGVFSPVNHEGNVLVDGGVINNLPVDVMRGFSEKGTVIAVDVSPQQEAARQWDFDTSISGWQVLASKLNPFTPAKRVPNLVETIVQAMVVNSTYRQRRARDQADLLINLDTSGYGIMDLEAHAELIDFGYETAVPIINTWLSDHAPH